MKIILCKMGRDGTKSKRAASMHATVPVKNGNKTGSGETDCVQTSEYEMRYLICSHIYSTHRCLLRPCCTADGVGEELWEY